MVYFFIYSLFLFCVYSYLCLNACVYALISTASFKGLFVFKQQESDLKIQFAFCSAEHIYIPFCSCDFHKTILGHHVLV